MTSIRYFKLLIPLLLLGCAKGYFHTYSEDLVPNEPSIDSRLLVTVVKRDSNCYDITSSFAVKWTPEIQDSSIYIRVPNTFRIGFGNQWKDLELVYKDENGLYRLSLLFMGMIDSGNRPDPVYYDAVFKMIRMCNIDTSNINYAIDAVLKIDSVEYLIERTNTQKVGKWCGALKYPNPETKCVESKETNR